MISLQIGKRPEIKALAGFLLSGFLFSLLGALLPAWGYDVSSEYAVAGRFFLAIVSGMVLSAALVRRFASRTGARTMLVSGCGLAALGLVALAALPDQVWWRALGLLVVGAAAGLLHTGLFQAVLAVYEREKARAINLAGILFGSGCIAAVLLVSGTYYAYSLETILLTLAALPVLFVLLYARQPYPAAGIVSHPTVLKQFRSGAAILFSLLLFFQFGNEWSIAGWLPLFLIHRLGASPKTALGMLAFYFAALTAGRVGVYYLLPRVNNWRMMAISAIASLFGCATLATTNNLFGAGVSVALIGLGFAVIYPLAAAWIGRRFPYYHPGFFNGIFSVALAGGMLAPWMLGEIADRAGMWTMVTLPFAGTCMVVLLLCLIWLHDKVAGE